MSWNTVKKRLRPHCICSSTFPVFPRSLNMTPVGEPILSWLIINPPEYSPCVKMYWSSISQEQISIRITELCYIKFFAIQHSVHNKIILFLKFSKISHVIIKTLLRAFPNELFALERYITTTLIWGKSRIFWESATICCLLTGCILSLTDNDRCNNKTQVFQDETKI